MEKFSVFWFRRDLRLEDNVGFFHALTSGKKVIPLFIFDSDITSDLPDNDPRLGFIYETLQVLNKKISAYNSSLIIEKGKPLEVWKRICSHFQIDTVFTNHDYEPYSIKRDEEVKELLHKRGVHFSSYKDQVIFERSEVTKADGSPYTVFTPYKKQWLSILGQSPPKTNPSENYLLNLAKLDQSFPSMKDLGFSVSKIKVRPFTYEVIENYDEYRNYPAEDRGSYFGPYLRFGLVSIRYLIDLAIEKNDIYLSELIWREFFMQILFHFPEVVDRSFKAKYDNIPWKNNLDDFQRWCSGMTGYPIVDAGMRQLNETGYMHNRVRMVTASFLCKHLLIDWRWGEAYFAQKLLDYELSSNNGNWQWAAGTGCDAAPYFRIFNPMEQQKKYDSHFVYIKRWVEEFDSNDYPAPIVDHVFARKRALETYKKALSN